MPALVVLTPSHAGDLDLCADLNRSVLACTDDAARHHIVVPRGDLPRFARLRGPRTEIHDEADFLPRSVVRLPHVHYSINLRRPYPPLRGWIVQQLVKLAFSAQVADGLVLLVDSDIVFRRPFSRETFSRDGVVRLYRKPDEIDGRLPRHVLWHGVARRLLGLEPAEPPLPDYISSLIAWDPALVRALLARVEAVGGRPWTSTIGGCLHFSEWTLYGVYVDALADGSARGYVSDDPRCHAYWETDPLDLAGLRSFLAQVRPDDLAVMVSAKSRTPPAVRRAGIDELLGSPRSDTVP